VEPGKSSEFLDLLEEVLPNTRSHDGCELVEAHVNQDDPHHLFLFEE
jgi:quinol monooxygenase YgiN